MCGPIASDAEQCQPSEGEQSVQHQHFVAEAVACGQEDGPVCQVADHRRGEGDVRYAFVAGAHPGEQTETEKSQQRPVGIRGQCIDGVYHAGASDGLEGQNAEDKDRCDEQVRALSYALCPLFRVAFDVQDVDAEAGGQGSQGRVGTGEGGSDDTDGEEYQHRISQVTSGGEHGQQVIALGRYLDVQLRGGQYQQDAQAEKEVVHRHEGESVAVHVLLGFFQVAAGQVLLHHVLVQSRHHDGDEDTAEELLEEVLFGLPVVEHEDAAVPAFLDGVPHSFEVGADQRGRLVQDEAQCQQQAEGLQAVGPYDAADAALAGIEPDKRHGADGGHGERNVIGVEYEVLKDDAYQVESGGGSQRLRQQEERSSRLVGIPAEAFAQVGVDGSQVQPVIKGEQHVGNDEVAAEEAHAGLHVGHVDGLHHARYRHEGYAGQGGPYHAERYDVPGGFAVPAEKGVVVGMAFAGPPGNPKQQAEI